MESIVGNKKNRFIWLMWLAAIPLLWWSLRNAPLSEIGGLLSNLGMGQIAAVIGINIFILIVISSRWWLILRGMGFVIPFGAIFGYRLASFGVSYFTPGAQFGGEPLQVALLNRKNGVPVVTAASSVYFDKLLELFINLLVLSAGILLLTGFGFSGDFLPGWIMPVMGLLLVIPVWHMAALWNGKYPFSKLVSLIKTEELKISFIGQFHEWISQGEITISSFMQNNPRALWLAFGLSLIAWIGMGLEYILLFRMVDAAVTWQGVGIGLVASRLAFLTPLPGGLGALEASQVLAVTSIGIGASVGITISLLMRARDIFFGLLGLVIGGIATSRATSTQQNEGL